MPPITAHKQHPEAVRALPEKPFPQKEPYTTGKMYRTQRHSNKAKEKMRGGPGGGHSLSYQKESAPFEHGAPELNQTSKGKYASLMNNSIYDVNRNDVLSPSCRSSQASENEFKTPEKAEERKDAAAAEGEAVAD